jgi:arginyl-tRNA--protein-N-Asp/Glu arginylyltransferase
MPADSGEDKMCNLSLYRDNIFLVPILEIRNKETNMKAYVNDFNYDEEEKRIVIKDNKHLEIWDKVEKDTNEEAFKLFDVRKNFDALLASKGCIRSWVEG